MPFVLRTSKLSRPYGASGLEMLEFVGETYVHGIMYGEAMKSGDLNFQEGELV